MVPNLIDLKRHDSSRLAAFNGPKRVAFHDRLSREGTGKIFKQSLLPLHSTSLPS